jgi:dihydrofolate reductase
MRPVGFYMQLTADGMYADAEGGLADVEPAEDEHRFANELVRDAGDIVVGRVVYEVMEYWDELDLEDPAVSQIEREFATYWRATPKHVVSRGNPPVRANAAVLGGDVVDRVRALRAADGPPVMVSGGAELLATLSKARLIDEYRFLLFPTAIGHGKAMFGRLEGPLRLRLTGTRTFSSGAVLLEYVPAGS